MTVVCLGSPGLRGSEITGTRNPNALLPAVQTQRVERPRPRGHGAQRRERPDQPAKVGMARDGWSRGRDRSTRRVDMVFGANKTGLRTSRKTGRSVCANLVPARPSSGEPGTVTELSRPSRAEYSIHFPTWGWHPRLGMCSASGTQHSLDFRQT